MPTTATQIATKYPLPVYNYRVVIEDKDLAFSEVSGLNIEYETLIYRHGLSAKEGDTYMPGMGTPVSVTLKRGIINNDQALYLYNWMGTLNLNNASLRDINVSLCDKDGKPTINWKVIQAFPVNLEMPTFDSNDDDVAVESLELMAHNLEMSLPQS